MDRLGNEVEFYNLLKDKIKFEIRCAAPGIIKEWFPEKQTVTVQLVTREKVVLDGVLKSLKVPILQDVPIFMPRSGNFVMTLPITIGDECLVVFSDTMIDAWFQNGGEENEQIITRRHDLSDAIALCGIWNQKRVVENYSTDNLEIRNLENTTKVTVGDDFIKAQRTEENYVEITDDSVYAQKTENNFAEITDDHIIANKGEMVSAELTDSYVDIIQNADNIYMDDDSVSITKSANSIVMTDDSIDITAPLTNVNGEFVATIGGMTIEMVSSGITLLHSGATIIISGGDVSVEAANITLRGNIILDGTITATSTLGVTGALTVTGPGSSIDGKVFLTHAHSGVESGSSDTGPVV
jgi:hypothetical protein